MHSVRRGGHSDSPPPALDAVQASIMADAGAKNVKILSLLALLVLIAAALVRVGIVQKAPEGAPSLLPSPSQKIIPTHTAIEAHK